MKKFKLLGIEYYASKSPKVLELLEDNGYTFDDINHKGSSMKGNLKKIEASLCLICSILMVGEESAVRRGFKEKPNFPPSHLDLIDDYGVSIAEDKVIQDIAEYYATQLNQGVKKKPTKAKIGS